MHTVLNKVGEKKVVKPTGTLFRARLLPSVVVWFHRNIPRVVSILLEERKKMRQKDGGDKKQKKRTDEMAMLSRREWTRLPEAIKIN